MSKEKLKTQKNPSKKEKTSVVKTILTVIVNVLLYLFIAVCIFGIIVSITSKKDDDGATTIFGVQMRSVISPSMEKCDLTDVSSFEIKDIPTKSLVFIKVLPETEEEKEVFYSSLKVGDVLTFKYTYVTQETITHRITSITKKDTGGYIIELEGDNKNTEDGILTQVIDTSDVVSPNYVIGKVTGTSYTLGLFVYAIKTPVGIICIVILPSLIIVVLEIIRIVNLLSADKKKKLKAQSEELEKLREKLKELESAKLEEKPAHTENSVQSEENTENSENSVQSDEEPEGTEN